MVAVARTGPALAELATSRANIRTEVADATEPTVAWSLLDQHQPEVLVLVAGANPVMSPLQRPDLGDVLGQLAHRRQDHLHLAACGAAAAAAAGQQGGGGQQRRCLNGSPASGGYAGSKATQRFLAGYAQEESRRAGLDLTVTAVLPRMTPFGDVGRRGVRAYAARGGQTEEAYLQQLGELLTPERAGSAVVELVGQTPRPRPPGTCSPPPGCRPPMTTRSGHGRPGRAAPAPRSTRLQLLHELDPVGRHARPRSDLNLGDTSRGPHSRIRYGGWPPHHTRRAGRESEHRRERPTGHPTPKVR